MIQQNVYEKVIRSMVSINRPCVKSKMDIEEARRELWSLYVPENFDFLKEVDFSGSSFERLNEIDSETIFRWVIDSEKDLDIDDLISGDFQSIVGAFEKFLLYRKRMIELRNNLENLDMKNLDVMQEWGDADSDNVLSVDDELIDSTSRYIDILNAINRFKDLITELSDMRKKVFESYLGFVGYGTIEASAKIVNMNPKGEFIHYNDWIVEIVGNDDIVYTIDHRLETITITTNFGGDGECKMALSLERYKRDVEYFLETNGLFYPLHHRERFL